eukprot:767813-Hanusia_phi.AAC.6
MQRRSSSRLFRFMELAMRRDLCDWNTINETEWKQNPKNMLPSTYSFLLNSLDNIAIQYSYSPASCLDRSYTVFSTDATNNNIHVVPLAVYVH